MRAKEGLAEEIDGGSSIDLTRGEEGKKLNELQAFQ